MKRATLLLSLILVTAAFLAYEYLGAQRQNRLYPQVDSYALAYDLKPLRPGHANELRLWSLEPMEGGVSASIFTESGAFACKGKSEYGSGDASLTAKPSRCEHFAIDLSRGELERTLQSLRALEGSDANCHEVVDGWRITVEGVVDGERFVFESWNPDGCDNADAKKLIGILAGIGHRKR
jgi:hypothetical protein